MGTTCMVSLSCGCYMHGEFELWVIACMVTLVVGGCMHGEFELWVQHAW